MQFLKTRMLRAGLLSLLPLLLMASDAWSSASFEGLDYLPEWAYGSQAYDVSADGYVIVGKFYSAGGAYQAFRWTRGGAVECLGGNPLGGEPSIANGVSGDGSVVVGTFTTPSSSWTQAFRWTAAGGLQGLGYLRGGGLTDAHAISRDGSTIIGYGLYESTDGSGNGCIEAFRWTAQGGMYGLGDFPGGDLRSHASAVSASGSVVFGYGTTAQGPRSCRWTETAGMEELAEIGNAFVRAVSADASVIVGSRESIGGLSEAIRWTESGGIMGLGVMPGGHLPSDTIDASDDGMVIIGHSFNRDGLMENFIWTPDKGMRSLRETLVEDCGLDLTDWTLIDATAISGDGRTIVGWDDGTKKAWVATIPEPTTLSLLALGGLLAIRRHCTRRLS